MKKKLFAVLIPIVFICSLVWAADVKISELPAVTTLAGTDVVPVVASGATSKITVTDLLTIFQAADADLTTWAGITPSANVQTLLGSADYAAFRTNAGLAIGTNVQAYNAILASIAGLTATSDALLGWVAGATPTMTAVTTHLHDDSAAQFKSATASKGTLKFDQTGITNGKLVTVKYTSADNYTFTPTITGNTGVTYPTSGTLIGHDGTDANLGAVNLLTTGVLKGGLAGYLSAASNTISGSNLYGSLWYLSTAATQYLAAGAPNQTVAFMVTAATNPLIKPAGSGVISNGTSNYSAGSGIKLTGGAVGNYISLHNLEGTTWYVWGKSGTYTSEGN